MDDTRGTELLLQILPEIQQIEDLPLSPPGVEPIRPPHLPGPSDAGGRSRGRTMVQLAEELEYCMEAKRRLRDERAYATAMSLPLQRKLSQMLKRVDTSSTKEREMDERIAAARDEMWTILAEITPPAQAEPVRRYSGDEE